MILKLFLLGNPLSLCMKIINSVVVVGLYYGFLTTFSIGPSYLFLLRARVMEEGTEGEVSATTGFIAGQLMMFISIYYAPLHLALGRPHTITVLVLPYLLFHFFWNNHKNFFDYGSTTRNSMRNLSIQCVFLNNLIFQLFNHFILPSSTLARLVNIYMFRCNNKIFFLTSSFVGWLIGHILFMKWVGLALFWIRQNNSIRSNKYLVSELRNSDTRYLLDRILSILLFITCVYYLGRMPSPIVTNKLKTSETEEGGERKEESDVETTSETKETKQEQENPSLCSDETEEIQVNGKEKKKDEFHFKEARYQDSPVYEDSDLETHRENWELGRLKEEKRINIKKKIENTFLTFFFDSQRWNRPLRYIKNNQLENALRNEMSQFFFFTCKSDGKQIISFTYPPSLSTFSEMLKRRITLYIIEKLDDKDLSISNSWIYTNEKKKCNLNNELRNRIQIIEKNEGFPSLDMLEKRIILCDDENQKKCLPKVYDPFFNGPYRGMRKKLDSCVIRNPYTDIEDLVEIFLINKIHDLLLHNSFEFYHQFFLNYTEEKKIDSENQAKSLQFLFDVITTHANRMRIEELSKKVSRWSYKLTDSLEEDEEEEYNEIHSRRVKRVVINDENTKNTSKNDDETEEVALIRYSQQSDFRRNLIKGSMRAQRRKTVIWELFQVNVHSPLFFDRLDKTSFFSYFDINETKNFVLRNWMGRQQESKLQISHFENEDTKEEKEKREKNERIETSEAWNNRILTRAIRSLMLVTQSFFRKYIILPSFIIAKHIFRMLLLQSSEWYEDLKEWKREIHIKCTYSGVQFSETEFPQDWLTDGIQIKILYPFCLKPWRKSKVRSHHRDQMKKKDFGFLTVWGMEAELPFGSPRKRPFFFEPIYKELKKRNRKWKNPFFQVLQFFKKKKGIIQIVRVIKRIMKKVYEPNKNEKYFKRNNEILRESSVLIRPMNWFNSSLIERRIQDISDKTIKIRNQIEQTTKDKKKKEIVLIYDKKRLESQKNILKIFQRQTIRLMRKSHYFIQSFIEKIYIDILLCTITFSKINAQRFFESTKKIFKKSIYNNKRNQEQEGTDETDKKTMNLNFTIKKLFSNTNNTENKNENFHIFWNLSSLSQAYVFYKLSQTQLLHQLLNKYHLRPLLQYQGNSPFFQDKLKDYCMIHGIFHFKSRDKKIPTYVINEWKNWLKGHYQYDLSKKKRSRLVPKEWQNRMNQRRMIQNKESIQLDFYKKYQLIHSMKKNDYETNSFMSQKYKWKKHYRYDLLSYKYIHLPNSYISESTLERNGTQEITYYFDISKPQSSNNYLDKVYLIDRNTNLDRKYLDCRILNLFFIKNMEIQTEIPNFKKMEKKDLFFPTIRQEIKMCNQKKKIFDCMGMNQERFYYTASNNDTISDIEPWFFPEFVLLFDVYKIEPWIIPIKSLFFHFSFHKKKDLELKNSKQEEDEQQQKREMELYSFFKTYFPFQFRLDDPSNQKIMKNIRVYCLLLRLINLKEIAISSIRRGQINLDEILIQKDLVLSELIRRGILIMEPICLSIRRDGKSIIYQTIDIFLVNKKKCQTNKKYKKKEYIGKGGFEKSITRHNNIFLSGDNNNYYFLVPENILSPVRRREFRIQICFNSKNWNVVDKNPRFCNENKIRNCGQFLNEDKHFHTDGKIFMKLKLFFWPNYRLEDLACMNRYWFDTNNSSRFSMSRIHMYSQF
uniref:hypothetical chloroplast RF1 n=1 Tax=Corybas obscurus TaxID=1902265 RepID=UPI001EDCAF0D|nr:hypothetical chloroplast RF1 [Corybas obscurus]YP_010260722.1 hypothetical chloroplast RF1 [Corybas obscurus]UIX55687.1 hypothetical chloroplast RF1 [Corybas obscurus]UIX55695.1 hypothetical chloroplast RF1 [Corybas obscurus]